MSRETIEDRQKKIERMRAAARTKHRTVRRNTEAWGQGGTVPDPRKAAARRRENAAKAAARRREKAVKATRFAEVPAADCHAAIRWFVDALESAPHVARAADELPPSGRGSPGRPGIGKLATIAVHWFDQFASPKRKPSAHINGRLAGVLGLLASEYYARPVLRDLRRHLSKALASPRRAIRSPQ